MRSTTCVATVGTARSFAEATPLDGEGGDLGSFKALARCYGFVFALPFSFVVHLAALGSFESIKRSKFSNFIRAVLVAMVLCSLGNIYLRPLLDAAFRVTMSCRRPCSTLWSASSFDKLVVAEW